MMPFVLGGAWNESCSGLLSFELILCFFTETLGGEFCVLITQLFLPWFTSFRFQIFIINSYFEFTTISY